LNQPQQTDPSQIAIVGGGIGGLTLALLLDQRGIACQVYEAAPKLKALGAGISLLPHGTRELAQLGLLEELERRAVRFRESCFFTSSGQMIFRDPANSEFPQLLIHRADLHEILVDAVRERLGAEAIALGHECTGFEQDEDGVTAALRDFESKRALDPVSAAALIACDGLHSAVRAQLYPGEDGFAFSGINMWRGLSVHPKVLSGGSHIRIGSLRTGKLVVYPVRDDVDGQGNQLVNWVAEIIQTEQGPAEWSRQGDLDDFIGLYEDWHFDWLDVPAMLRRTETVLEYPMVDRDPIDRWTFGRVTLLGDAAHPMLPRGSNGAMQAVLDGRALADALAAEPVPAALARYERERLERVNRIVLTNRSTPPDFLIETVQQRTDDQPFDRLEDVVEDGELAGLMEKYKRLTGYDAASLSALEET
jgi:2-polyprenyl-6-methoxyphenol hydroxylase-like FAD-dependent oxidoreductase